MRGLRAIPGTVQPCRSGMATSQSLVSGGAALHGFGALARGPRCLDADQQGIGCGRVRSFADKEVRAADTPRRHRAVGPLAVIWASPGAARHLGRGVCRSPRALNGQAGNAPRRRPDRQGTGRWPPVMPPAGLGAGVASVFGQAVRRRLGQRAGRWQSSANATRPWRCAPRRAGDRVIKAARLGLPGTALCTRSRWRAWQDRHARRWQPWLSHILIARVASRVLRSACAASPGAGHGGPGHGGAWRISAPVAAGCSPVASRERAPWMAWRRVCRAPVPGLMPGPGAGPDAGPLMPGPCAGPDVGPLMPTPVSGLMPGLMSGCRGAGASGLRVHRRCPLAPAT